MTHQSDFKIRTFHTDAFGHVNNSRHLELLEEARWQFAESIGLVELLTTLGLGFIIIDMRIRFRSPVVEGDEIRIETGLVALGSASGEVKQTVYQRGESSAALKSTFHFILIDRSTAKSVPIEGAIRELLESVLVKKP